MSNLNDKIIIIDDEPLVLEVLDSMIHRLGYKTESYPNVHNALYNIKDFSFKLIILDYSIPKEDGVENIYKLKDLNKDAKIILLSGYDTSKMNELINIGVYDFLQKPVDIDVLKIAITRALKD